MIDEKMAEVRELMMVWTRCGPAHKGDDVDGGVEGVGEAVEEGDLEGFGDGIEAGIEGRGVGV